MKRCWQAQAAMVLHANSKRNTKRTTTPRRASIIASLRLMVLTTGIYMYTYTRLYIYTRIHMYTYLHTHTCTHTRARAAYNNLIFLSNCLSPKAEDDSAEFRDFLIFWQGFQFKDPKLLLLLLLFRPR
jgi:hypothetical protein